MLRKERLETRLEKLKEALNNWQDRLVNLEFEKSITSNVNVKFDLEKQIKICDKEIEIAKDRIEDFEKEFLQVSEGKTPKSPDETPVLVPTDLRPYAEKLDGWKKTDYKDRLQLLSRQELQASISWVENHEVDISDIDKIFLIKSIVWNAKRTEKNISCQQWKGNEALIKPPFHKALNTWLSSDRKKKNFLLSSDFLRKTIAWADANNLNYKEHSFLVNSIIENMDKTQAISENEKVEVSSFIQKNWQNLKSKTDNPYTVFYELISWTGCQPFLTQKICEIIFETESKISKGEESHRVISIVEKYFNKDSENQEIAQHFQRFYSLILDDENHDSFWLLFCYRRILKNQEIESIDTQASINFLRTSGLIVSEHDRFRVHNPIYQSIFNEEWIEHNIVFLRPYSQKLLNWIDSQCQDNTQLLNKSETQDAILWMQENHINPAKLENKFLAYSMEL
ncbi:MAG: hypothetical protein AAGF93_10760 [Cyanobacteria bacterium P01_H01_bin.105]